MLRRDVGRKGKHSVNGDSYKSSSWTHFIVAPAPYGKGRATVRHAVCTLFVLWVQQTTFSPPPAYQGEGGP